MTQKIQEFPKMIYGPQGQYVIVEDAEQEAQQKADWSTVEPVELLDEPPSGQVVRRGPGRPRKVA